MTSADKPRYSLDNFDNLPTWLKRSWNIFVRVNIRADYRRDIATTREAIQLGGAYKANEIIRIQRDYELGQGMDKLIKLQIARPDVTDNELLNVISPTVRFINYGVGEVQPSDDPKAEFKANERLNKLYVDNKNTDISRGKELTYLLIPPNTTKDELKDFIDEYYENAEYMIKAGEPYFKSDKNTKKRITKITEDSIIDERIYELRSDGVYPKSIANLINFEFDRDLEPFEVSKRLNQMRRRKNRQ